MSSPSAGNDALESNPLDLVEQLVFSKDWAYDRPAEEELVAETSTTWCNLRYWFTWRRDMNALMFSCSFDAKVPQAMRPQIYPLLALVNERLWLGHFDLCQEDGTISFRHTLLTHETQQVTEAMLEELLAIASEECERFYPAFQSVFWGGRAPEEAMELAIFDTVGEA